MKERESAYIANCIPSMELETEFENLMLGGR
jgi:hypothetical protein